MSSLPPRGLSVITSDALCRDADTLLRGVTAALRGGAVIVQYRDKLNDAATRLAQARRLQALCREAGVPLIINDGPAALVAAEGFDGMHLGLDDGDLAAARRLAPQALIGATCGASLPRALVAVQAGASYVAFGAFHPSDTKPLAAAAPISLLREARAALSLPICAIGGITPDNAQPLIEAGADYIAAIGGVFGVPDIEAAARRYSDLFKVRIA
ncbi:MAG: thiamine phosphate synthase [Pseudomonadota bacterium]